MAPRAMLTHSDIWNAVDRLAARAGLSASGLAKKAEQGRSLPPGWDRKCVRGAVIPAEVYRQCAPLPQEVVVKLPPAPANTIVVTLDSKIFRWARASLEILDVFDAL